MKNGTLVIFDYELDYANNLMNYINRKKILPFAIQVFTNISNLVEHLKDNQVEVLLISSDVDIEVLNRANIKNLYLLSEGKYVNEGLEYPSIYKFQSAANILDEVLLLYTDSKAMVSQVPYELSKNQLQIIGVFSPLGNCGKTSFALTLGQILAEKKSVLYISLENFSALGALIQECPDKGLSELIYFLRERKINLGFKIKALTCNINQMDYIPSPNCCLDIFELKKEDWELLIKDINENSNYDFIILDIGFMNQAILELINLCKIIYMPVKTDFISEAKLRDFENIINIYDIDMLSTKFKKLNIPYNENMDKRFNMEKYNINDLISDVVGEYVRSIAAELMQ